jgi:hypothetical protein
MVKLLCKVLELFGRCVYERAQHLWQLSFRLYVGHILRRNCLLKHVIEGKFEGSIEMTGRRGRRRK